jgi:diadenosine tetraphosphate (Ap4A) HIT family hydrolase
MSSVPAKDAARIDPEFLAAKATALFDGRPPYPHGLLDITRRSLIMTDFTLHPRLLADCHRLGRLPASHLLLHRNAAVPWLILVPETALANLLDLPVEQRDAVLADCKRASDYLTEVLACPKVNVGWIGNLVPQLHIHVIGRHPTDPCWPQPVWGHLTTVREYSPSEIDRIKAGLMHAGAGSARG